MKKSAKILGAAVLGCAVLAAAVGSAVADNGKRNRQEVWRAFLLGVNETPSVSTPGKGRFRAVIDEDSSLITFTLSYEDLSANPSVAHIHFGERHMMGGVMVFLCGGGGQPACPPSPAEITGTITPANVVGPAAQGIVAGEFAEVLAAIRAGAGYANVHTPNFPPGEIRGQLSR
jgi:hypothetical protein